MNIFCRELKANAKSLLIWCCAQFFLVFAGMVKYGSFSASDVDLNLLMSQFPKGLMAVFGIGEVNMAEVSGFYSMFFLYFMLMTGIHAAMLGAVLITKEERDHAADFLYAKPVSRRTVITAKLLAGLFNILAINLLTFCSSLYFISMYNDGNPLVGMVARMMLALLILQILFLCIGSALGAVLRTARAATGAAAGILLGTFILSIGIDLNSRLDFLKYLTPFKYFNSIKLVYDGGYPAASLLICAGLTGFCIWTTFTRFGSRDLTT